MVDSGDARLAESEEEKQGPVCFLEREQSKTKQRERQKSGFIERGAE